MIVTIDGPAGSGKSSAAKALARRLNFEVLDTGAMYRAVALAALRATVHEDDDVALTELLARIRIEMPPGRVILDGEDISEVIRTPEASQAASRFAAIPRVRRFLVELQRRIASGRNMVCEGRDQGTVAFPDADCKFYFVADPMERARRRLSQLQESGNRTATLETVLVDQAERDRRDASRDLAPMAPADDAVIIDTTHLSRAEVLDTLERKVRSCWPS